MAATFRTGSTQSQEPVGFFQVPHTGAGDEAPGESSTAFPGHSKELNWKSGQDTNQCPDGMQVLQAEAQPTTP